jgi:hypothetical protein
MNVQTVFPSAVMKISCPKCKAEGTLKRENPPEKDLQVLCPKCKERFLVKINLRKFYRREVSIPVKYYLVDGSGTSQKTKGGTIVDLSREGLCIESDTRSYAPGYHREGKRFSMSFALPPGDTVLNVDGEVVRIIKAEGKSTFRIGIKFSNLDGFSSKQIAFFLWP